MIPIPALLLFLAAQDPAPPSGSTPPPPPSQTEAHPRDLPPTQAPAARIQWFGTLEQGLAEAARTGRPLMMTAAAPACRGIAGMW